MKRKEDDLSRLDGKALPTWVKAVITVISFAAGIGLGLLFYMLF